MSEIHERRPRLACTASPEAWAPQDRVNLLCLSAAADSVHWVAPGRCVLGEMAMVLSEPVTVFHIRISVRDSGSVSGSLCSTILTPVLAVVPSGYRVFAFHSFLSHS